MRNIAASDGVGDNVSTPEQIAANFPSSNQPTTTAGGGGTGASGGSGKPGGKPVRSESTAGILFGIGAYGLWGLLPLYFFVLMPASAIEIVANRIVWSLLFCALLITITRAWRVFGAAVKDRTVFGPLALAAVLIAINWLTYTFGVTTGHAVETSLGYFINPLVSVLLGVFVLKEKLRPLQWTAVGIGFVAVGVLTFSYGQLPWIALILAFSFGLYGFVKKRVGPKVDALTSLSVETVVLAPFAAITMVVLAVTGVETLTTLGAGHFWLLVASGVITAVPLLFFGASARRLPMTTIGLLQYFAPVLQFIVALAVFNETMTTARWIGFCVVWLALILLTIDMLRTTRKNSVLKKQAQRKATAAA
ncbi:EamA family transporter RarD [Paenarthrobacter aurescens]|uniref:Protein RarD n=1 Tax=Paenarthrobacter aurescens TaxID=43663 RepID=A0A4Y3N9S4_PAEAU|nr:EamA family transporter RarD [Paenarthrobacter aurescens]MDO6144470.1 EamA family transporter RarD [Paenarthrobacter aurescens]MDO6148317.1 EamA family transporter RarD [Paenarthrobacter aurescens]MDO6159561.1 EamA family transporter RarD [Paenarthrobacter aurescens]MDO6163544.1 EamA family transporter RarD [Paenarthrobacter aurescens]GEB18033.1 protein RarD [Paenarthrobacter aurescens]